jgi:hypothetical protein
VRSEQCTQLSVHCFALQISNQTVALVSEVMIETNECILSGLRIGTYMRLDRLVQTLVSTEHWNHLQVPHSPKAVLSPQRCTEQPWLAQPRGANQK